MAGMDACGYSGVPTQVYTSEAACGIGRAPRGCQVRIPLVASIAASTTVASPQEVKIEPIQPGRLVKLIDEGSAATVGIKDMKIDGRSLAMDFNQDGSGANVELFSAPLSSVLRENLYENSAQPLPPTGRVERNNPLSFFFTNSDTSAATAKLGMYFKFE